MGAIVQRSIAIGAVLFSNCVFAATPCPYDHFYLGANIGFVSLNDNESTSNPAQNTHLRSTGPIGGILGGYDLTLKNRFKLGIEAFANITDLSLTDNQNNYPGGSYTVNMNYDLGLRFLPGYEMMPGAVGHFIIGYAYGKFSINDDGNYGMIDTQFEKNGIQYGVGLTMALNNNLSIRSDIIYTNYFSETSNGVTTTAPLSTQVYKNDLSTIEGSLMLIYKIA